MNGPGGAPLACSYTNFDLAASHHLPALVAVRYTDARYTDKSPPDQSNGKMRRDQVSPRQDFATIFLQSRAIGRPTSRQPSVRCHVRLPSCRTTLHAPLATRAPRSCPRVPCSASRPLSRTSHLIRVAARSLVSCRTMPALSSAAEPRTRTARCSCFLLVLS